MTAPRRGEGAPDISASAGPGLGTRPLSDQLWRREEGTYLFTRLPRSQTPGSLRTGLGFWAFVLRLQLTFAGSQGCLFGNWGVGSPGPEARPRRLLTGLGITPLPPRSPSWALRQECDALATHLLFPQHQRVWLEASPTSGQLPKVIGVGGK